MPALAFVALCLAWGGTWLAIRIGVHETPPLWLAATRFTVAGLLLLGVARFAGGWRRISLPDLGRLVVMSAGAISICFGLIFWGEQYVESGLAGVLVQGFVPIGLFAFAMLLGKERVAGRQLVGLLLGLAGVALLILTQIRYESDARVLAGTVAIIVGTLIYDWAGVYGGNLLSRYPAPLMSAYENLIGGVLLLPVSLVLEGHRLASDGLVPNVRALGSWLYLVVIGSMVGFTAYTYLLAKWGPTRTSAYAFVTPVVAVTVGVFFAGEHLRWQDLLGAGMVVIAVVFIVTRRRPATDAAPVVQDAVEPEQVRHS
ncbi:permease [Actinoplanes lobatus]|uniref:Permease n=1 Tax=Actinoplanes lobatus TaxID=113568 RepID=A0A7W7MEN1_9ACTN|nr:EamA family transporter [Actinoplanes lobatus]MBB4747393.1 drug/metabolite transporter (DMT)-like permease [Actinoplanes lobatus]GGN79041.1 permease [Actinoplanes lobatus]GIE42636.1 permease [Actinoplanes lobatus]